jgi:hypothetical protein
MGLAAHNARRRREAEEAAAKAAANPDDEAEVTQNELSEGSDDVGGAPKAPTEAAGTENMESGSNKRGRRGKK